MDLRIIVQKARRSYPSAALLLIVAVFLCAGCSRSHTEAATPPQKLPPLEFIGEWGTRGALPGQFQEPIGPATDVNGRIYFADRATGFVEKFAPDGKPLLTFEHPAARSADAIAVDSGGAIYLANNRTGAIQVFFPQGDPLRVLRVAPRRKWDGPFLFTTDTDGRIFVPDPAESRIEVLTPQGRIQKIWNLAARTSAPVHPCAAIAAADDSVYVWDSAAGSVLKFSNTGEDVSSWHGPAVEPPIASLAAAGNRLYVLRSASPRLEVWSADGHLEFADDLGGRLQAPSGSLALAANSQGDVMIVDLTGAHVLHFRLRSEPPE